MKLTTMLVALLVGCGGEDVPSCSQAIGHYYSNGCQFVDLQTGQPAPQNQVIAGCQSELSTIPARCKDEHDTFLSCLNSVPAASTAADCDCSQESDAYLSCL